MKAAYSVIYTAMRSGSVMTHSILYSKDEEINDSEGYTQLLGEVSRYAVSNAQANAISDVVITSVTLLNPNRDMVTLATTELEAKYLELYEHVESRDQGLDSLVDELITAHREQYTSIKEGQNDEQ